MSSSSQRVTGAAPRLRIAMLVHRFGRQFGGAEAYVENLARALAPQHDVDIIAFEYQSPLKLPFVRVNVPKRLPSWMRALAFAHQAQRLTRQGYDVVHSHMNGAAGHIHTVHVTPTHHHLAFRDSFAKRCLAKISLRKQTYLALERARFQQGKQTVAVSSRIAHQLSECGLTARQATVIAPGVAAAMMLPGQRHMTRLALGWDDSILAGLMVARNPLRKGLSTLIEAAAHLPRHIRFVIVGADDAARDAVANATAVADRFVCVAATSDVEPWMHAADLFLHPTREDSFGMAPLEALAQGLPLVVSGPAHCGLSHELQTRHHALLLDDPRSAPALTQAILELADDPVLRRTLSTNGRLFAEKNAWANVAGRYLHLYQTIAPIDVRYGE